jgi:inner membrane protein
VRDIVSLVTDVRYFSPWRPITVSPISVRRFFDGRGWTILGSEFVVVWIPAIALWAGGVIARRVLSRR